MSKIKYYCNSDMNIILSIPRTEFNCTGDYNILTGIKSLMVEENLPFTICSDNNFHKKTYEELKKKYNMDINSIITIHTNDNRFKNFPDHVKQLKYVVDIHGWLPLKENITYLLPYGYSYDRFKKNPHNYAVPNNKVIFFPHSVIHSCKFNENPINKVLISGRGRKNSRRYPMRYLFHKKSLRDSRLEYFKPDHGYRPTEEQMKAATYGEKFIKKLSEYLCCFCDDSEMDTPYILCKVYEIMSSGSLLLGCLRFTKKYFAYLGFIENIHYIHIDSLIDYEKKISLILDPKNRNKINEIRKNGYNHCLKFHNSKYRAKQLYNYLTKGDSVLIQKNDGLNAVEDEKTQEYTNNGKYFILKDLNL